MKNKILISTFAVLLFACNAQQDNKSAVFASADSSVLSLADKKSEIFFPETKGIEKFDTIIADRQIQIVITKTDLDSYVTNEYDEGGHKQVDKYRDAEISLTIKQKSKTLLDTIFRKEQFTRYAEKGFMNIAILHNYWFNKLDKDRVEFFGVISKPETDWTIDFHHYFDLNTNKLTFKQETSDEE